MQIFIDLETLPTNNPEVIKKLRDSIKVPATHKKPETIKEYIEEKHQELVAKTALDGAYGMIACIAWSFGDECKIFTTTKEMTEKEVIQDFYKAVDDSVYKATAFCGHNIAGFDLPFLKHRSMILGIKPPQIIQDAFNAKPWDAMIKDTMRMWDCNKMISMDTLCWLFGIEGKGDMDGSKVAETWAKDPQKVIDYCAGDVKRAYQLYQRMIFSDKVF